jgi:hypothetical protein
VTTATVRGNRRVKRALVDGAFWADQDLYIVIGWSSRKRRARHGERDSAEEGKELSGNGKRHLFLEKNGRQGLTKT